MDKQEVAYKQQLSIDEMIFLVEEYIYDVKNVKVHINPIYPHQNLRQAQLLLSAFTVASDYFILKYPKNEQGNIKD